MTHDFHDKGQWAVSGRYRTAFTLIEVLVTIAVIAVVLSLAAVGMMRTKRTAIATKCAANLRSSATAVLAYTGDYRDSFPIQGAFQLTQSFNTVAYGWQDYFQQSPLWTIPARSYMGDTGANPAQFCADPALQRENAASFITDYPEGSVLHSDFWVSYATFTDPAAWVGDGTPGDERHFRAVRLSEVVYSSQKGLMIEPHAFHLGFVPSVNGAMRPRVSTFWQPSATMRFGVATMDGASQTPMFEQIVPARVGGGFGPERVVLATPGGIRGIDIAK